MKRDVRLGWLLCFGLSLALYAATASRGVQWADSTHFMYRIVHGDVTGHLGLALSHPLHHWLGRLAVAIAGPEPYVITLVSALFGALAVANVYGCAFALVARPGPAFFAAGSLALASTFWRVSTITEVYTLSAALLAATCWALVLFVRDGKPWLFWLACFANGLGGANDLQSGLTMVVLVVAMIAFVRSGRLSVGEGAVAALVYLVGVMPYGALVIREWIESGDLAATVRSALFGTMWADSVLGSGLSRRVLLIDVTYPWINFPNLLLPAAAYGLARAKAFGIPPATRHALIGILAIQAAFALRYDIVEQYNFFIPMYVLLVLFAAVGAQAFLDRPNAPRWVATSAVVLLLATPGTLVVGTSFARAIDALDGVGRHKPYRDDYEYLMFPWSVFERSAERMSRQAIDLAGERGLIVSEDYMARYCIAYRAMLDGRPEPRMVARPHPERDELVRQAVADGVPVVLIPWHRDFPEVPAAVGVWQRDGDLYVLDPSAVAVSDQPPVEAAATPIETTPSTIQ